ncbi:MAG TPA: helicase C-terminal domain-containing protein [Soehngenia sp.]|nr:helicase C-terminal domain-containing protein [Soehngenia sp.]HPP31241.1 helicase C-terminal domain-containing protein [Soehngenia sp.]
MQKHIRLSVRNLIETTLRSGDIDNRFMSTSRALEGTLAHQKIQSSYKKGDLKEVTLSIHLEYKGFIFEIDGRADGIIFDEENVIIDEIKTTTRNLENLEEEISILHLAQALCYAFIYQSENNLEQIMLSITYFNIENESMKKIMKKFSRVEVENFFYSLLDKYIIFAQLVEDWKLKRNNSIKKIEFPFKKYRKGQRELAIGVYTAIKDQKRLFVKAPTGIGKTMSTIFPSLKALEKFELEKIFYLTAKTLTQEAPVNSIKMLMKNGLSLKTSILTSKERICLNEEVKCNPIDCPYAKGHYDRVNDAIIDIFNNYDLFTYDVMIEYSRKHQVCPFEYQLDLSLYADMIICDYNYAFDPQVYLRRFFEFNNGENIFLIDEAHNLIDRAREMYSASINTSELQNTLRILNENGVKKTNDLKKIIEKIKTRANEAISNGIFFQTEEVDDIYWPISKTLATLEKFLIEKKDAEGYDICLDTYFTLNSFLKISEYFGDNYVVKFDAGNEDYTLTLYCLDASKFIKNITGENRANVYFSATLTPINYFRDLLGSDKDDYHMILKSPFDKDNLLILINGYTSTRYKDRSKTYSDIAKAIYDFSNAKEGNYIVFFPSYAYLNAVYEQFKGEHPEIYTIKEESNLTKLQREEFLNEFSNKGRLISFCVLGGSFSEGIDLVGDKLIGAIIVGVGMPQISRERDILKGYFELNYNRGFDYAYTFPGMNKVMQAVGRVIRTENDKGAILLIDDRYLTNKYTSLMPSEWSNHKRIRSNEEMLLALNKFWRNVDKEKSI